MSIELWVQVQTLQERVKDLTERVLRLEAGVRADPPASEAAGEAPSTPSSPEPRPAATYTCKKCGEGPLPSMSELQKHNWSVHRKSNATAPAPGG